MSVEDTKELRGDAPADLVRVLDAYALSKGMSRNAYVNQVLMAHIKSLAVEHRLVERMVGTNPLMSE